MSIATIDRRLSLRLRPDVRIERGADGRWVTTDPVRMTNIELSEEEISIARWLGDRITLRELMRRYHQRFAPRRIEAEELDRRLARMLELGLLASTRSGQGDALWRRRQETRSRKRRWAWTRLLAVRLPGIDPDAPLTWLNRYFGWVFGWAGAALLAGMFLLAALVLLSGARDFAAELPGLAELAKPEWLISLFACLAVLKTLHELGHALACKHLGGEVREIGLLLLAGAPCLYCDVSTAWRLQDKRQRMLINVAGVLVELGVACVAVLVWSVSESHTVRMLCVNLVLLASLGTLLVNLNPLLRFDGYYLLSDALGVANLWRRSRTACAERVRSLITWRPKHPPQQEPLWMAVYGACSMAYLGAVLVGVGWVALSTLKTWRLEAFGWAVIALIAAAMTIPPLTHWTHTLSRPVSEHRWRWGRITGFLVICLLVGVGLWHTPSPWNIDARAVVLPNSATPVAVTLPGRLVWAIEPGERVEKGTLIGRLENPEVQRRLLRAEAEAERYRLDLHMLEARRAEDPEANNRLPAARAVAEESQRRLAELRADADRLELRALVKGVVLSRTLPDRETENDLLAAWEGDPLDRVNRGAWLETGDILCVIAPSGTPRVELFLDERDADRVAAGQEVRLALRQRHGTILGGTILQVARAPEPSPDSSRDQHEPARLICRAQVALEQEPAPAGGALIYGGGGEARVLAGWSTLGDLVTTTIRRAFTLP